MIWREVGHRAPDAARVWTWSAVSATTEDMKKLVLGVVALGALGYGVVHWRAAAPSRPAHTELVENRVWIDHMPRTERDTIQVFLTLGDDSMGVFQQSSVWKGSYELFQYEAHGSELRAVFPQTGERETMKAKATECSQNGFDYCLELSGGSRGAKRYYSMEGWELDSMRGLDGKVTEIRALGTPSSDPSSAHK